MRWRQPPPRRIPLVRRIRRIQVAAAGSIRIGAAQVHSSIAGGDRRVIAKVPSNA